MKNMTLANIAAACAGKLVCSEDKRNIEITGAQLDSRKIQPGNLFFATRGERVDGHDFIPQVVEKGAACVVCEKEPDTDAPYILVEDSFIALKQIAAYYRSQLTIPIIGITGSVGKTSTKEAIASVLSAGFRVQKTAGNFNNEVGLPLTILSIMDEHEIAVVEMGISDFGEMTRLSEIARPDVCVITNIGLCHLENLKTQQGILQAKTEMFANRNPEGQIILNGDDPLLSTILDVDGTKPLCFGTLDGNAVKIVKASLNGYEGSDFTLEINLGDRCSTLELHTTQPGIHAVTNAACAALIGCIMGLSNEQITDGIMSQQSVSGRSNVIFCKDYLVVDDCYNANPVSMKEAIDMLSMSKGRRVAILGDMFELGENEAALHKEIGEYAISKNVDVLLMSGELSRNMLEGANEAAAQNKIKPTIFYAKTRDELMAEIGGFVKAGDAILIKASHGMHYEKIVEMLTCC